MERQVKNRRALLIIPILELLVLTPIMAYVFQGNEPFQKLIVLKAVISIFDLLAIYEDNKKAMLALVACDFVILVSMLIVLLK